MVRRQNWPFVFIALVAMIMVVGQILTRGLILQDDSIFHYSRIFDTYQQLRSHEFSYFQMNNSFQQSGRVINAVYGPAFSYVLGGLLLLCGSWMKFQIISLTILFFISGTGMYILAKKVEATTPFALVVSIVFMGSHYIIAWGVSQQFSAWGLMLMPFILMNGIDMADTASKINILYLAISVAMIIQVHILSALFAILALVPFFLFGLWKSNNRLRMLCKVIIAAFLAILLTANVWGMALELFTKNYIVPPFPNQDMARSTYVPFANLHSLFSPNSDIVLSIVLLVTILLAFVIKNQPIVKLLAFEGLFFFILSSRIMPWDLLEESIPQLMTFLQFPIRFTSIATSLLLPVFAYELTIFSTFTNKTKAIVDAFSIICALSVIIITCGKLYLTSQIWFGNSPINTVNMSLSKEASPKNIRNAFRSSDLSLGFKLVQKESPDYLPSSKRMNAKLHMQVHPYYQYRLQFINRNPLFTKFSSGNKLVTTWKSSHSSKIQVPVAIYHNTSIKLNGKNLSAKRFTTSIIGALIIDERKGENKLVTKYIPSRITQIMMVTSLCTWILVSIVALYGLFRLMRGGKFCTFLKEV